MQVFLENIRCFSKPTTVELKPLTLLVGENSTGKSTFLATLAAMTDNQNFPFTIDFNKQPFRLGNYKTIATKRGQSRVAPSFRVAFENLGQAVAATYKMAKDWPQVDAISINKLGMKLDIAFSDEGKHIIGTMEVDGKIQHIDITSPKPILSYSDLLVALISREMRKSKPTDQGCDGEHDLVAFKYITEALSGLGVISSRSVAPIRSEPERFYSTAEGRKWSPEGGHVPLVLSYLCPVKGKQTKTKKFLDDFGVNSGLFSSIISRPYSEKDSWLFQIQAKVDNNYINIADVGYGVSQVLPVILDAIVAEQNTTTLLQQPEVHLHPKAQAALGTLFCQLAATGRRYVIETHSDFLINRIPIEISRGTLNCEDAALLYFEKGKGTIKIHSLTYDSAGNIIGAPDSYREFFIQEELNFLR